MKTRALPRYVKRFAVLIGVLSLSAICYYVVAVWQARARTPELVRSVLSSSKIKVLPADLTPWQKQALLAVEDPRFYDHNGVDLSTPGGGLTTISQAIVKILYFEKFQPGIAKIRQTMIARFAFNPLVSKEDQLTLFLNLIYLGQVNDQPTVGFADAAQAYFKKPLSELDESQFLALVALPIAPNRFSPHLYPERNADRVKAIKRMLGGRYRPKGLRDLYYGGNTFRPTRGALWDWWTRVVWGY